MFDSKIILAPIGYGEMAPRDLESAMFGSVLMKPDMSYISSEPFIYEDNETYIAVNYDWSNLEEKIDYVLSDYNNIQEQLVQNMRKKYQQKYNLQNLVLHVYNIFSKLDEVETS
jgi:glycosyltransferase involved in cell wall biosynthesis